MMTRLVHTLVVAILCCWAAAVNGQETPKCDIPEGMYDGQPIGHFDPEPRLGAVCKQAGTTQRLVKRCMPRFCCDDKCSCGTPHLLRTGNTRAKNCTNKQIYCYVEHREKPETINVCCPGSKMVRETRSCQFPDKESTTAAHVSTAIAQVASTTPASGAAALPYQYIIAAAIGALLLLLLPLLLCYIIRRCRRPPPAVFTTDAFANYMYDKRGAPLPAYTEEIDEKKKKEFDDGKTVVADDFKKVKHEPIYEKIAGEKGSISKEGCAKTLSVRELKEKQDHDTMQLPPRYVSFKSIRGCSQLTPSDDASLYEEIADTVPPNN